MKTHGSSLSPLLPITEIFSSGAQAQIQFLLTLNPLGWTTVQIHLWVTGQLLAWHRRPFSVQSQPLPSSSPLLTFQGSDPLNLWLLLKCFVLSTIEWTTCTYGAQPEAGAQPISVPCKCSLVNPTSMDPASSIYNSFSLSMPSVFRSIFQKSLEIFPPGCQAVGRVSFLLLLVS